MKNINFKSKEAESYYLNKLQCKSIKEMSENRQVSTRTIEREIADFKEQIKDLPFDEVIKSFADISLSYSNAELNKVTINELNEGRYFFYKNSTDELIFTGTLDEFFNKHTEYDIRWKRVIEGRNIKDSFMLEKIDLRIKCDFNKKYSTTEEIILHLENENQLLRNRLDKIEKILKDNFLL